LLSLRGALSFNKRSSVARKLIFRESACRPACLGRTSVENGVCYWVRKTRPPDPAQYDLRAPEVGIDRFLVAVASAHKAHKRLSRFRQVPRAFGRRDRFLAPPPPAPYRSAAFAPFAKPTPWTR
jgi:hypothetical protein